MSFDLCIYEFILNDFLVLAGDICVCFFFFFSHVKRLGNFVAHFLARHSKSSNKLQVWIESIPDDIALLVIHDS